MALSIGYRVNGRLSIGSQMASTKAAQSASSGVSCLRWMRIWCSLQSVATFPRSKGAPAAVKGCHVVRFQPAGGGAFRTTPTVTV